VWDFKIFALRWEQEKSCLRSTAHLLRRRSLDEQPTSVKIRPIEDQTAVVVGGGHVSGDLSRRGKFVKEEKKSVRSCREGKSSLNSHQGDGMVSKTRLLGKAR